MSERGAHLMNSSSVQSVVSHRQKTRVGPRVPIIVSFLARDRRRRVVMLTPFQPGGTAKASAHLCRLIW